MFPMGDAGCVITAVEASECAVTNGDMVCWVPTGDTGCCVLFIRAGENALGVLSDSIVEIAEVATGGREPVGDSGLWCTVVGEGVGESW